jgi:hypothetical protein
MDDLAIIELVVNRLRSEFGSDLLGVLAGGRDCEAREMPAAISTPWW